jgi:FkbM family methyltransferase
MNSIVLKSREALIKAPFIFDAVKKFFIFFKKDCETEILKGLIDEKTYLIQLGANDGIRNDPIRSHIVSGRPRKSVLFEPNPSPYQELVRAYSYLIKNGYNIELVNFACTASDNHQIVFYEINDKARYRLTHAHQRGAARKCGINPKNLKQYLIEVCGPQHKIKDDNVDDWIRASKVRALNIDQYLSCTEKVTLLVVDTEGLDWDLIASISPENMPENLMWERGEPEPSTVSCVINKLQDLGYKIKYTKRNVFALSSDLPDK